MTDIELKNLTTEVLEGSTFIGEGENLIISINGKNSLPISMYEIKNINTSVEFTALLITKLINNTNDVLNLNLKKIVEYFENYKESWIPEGYKGDDYGIEGGTLNIYQEETNYLIGWIDGDKVKEEKPYLYIHQDKMPEECNKFILLAEEKYKFMHTEYEKPIKEENKDNLITGTPVEKYPSEFDY